MLLFLIEGASQKCVQVIFDKLTEKLGTEIFHQLISIILTGNGGEFNASDSHGYTDYDVWCTNNFYISLCIHVRYFILNAITNLFCK